MGRNIIKNLNLVKKIFGFDIFLAEKIHIIFCKEKNKSVLFPENLDRKNLLVVTKRNFIEKLIGHDRSFFILHEFVERNITSELKIYENDRYTRWIGDGIAEYITYKVFKKRYPRKKFFKNFRFFKIFISGSPNFEHHIKNRGIKSVDLSEWAAHTLESIDGVDSTELSAVSQYFWYKICERFGDNIIGEFLEKLLKYKIPPIKN